MLVNLYSVVEYVSQESHFASFPAVMGPSDFAARLVNSSGIDAPWFAQADTDAIDFQKICKKNTSLCCDV